jgi:hypothetical protein
LAIFATAGLNLGDIFGETDSCLLAKIFVDVLSSPPLLGIGDKVLLPLICLEFIVLLFSPTI